MNENIFPEAGFFAVSFLTGLALMAVYDVILIFRFLIKHNKAAEAAEDLIYWSGAGIISFLMMYKMNFGIIRAFSIITIAAGMIVYREIRKIIIRPLKKTARRVKMYIVKKKIKV